MIQFSLLFLCACSKPNWTGSNFKTISGSTQGTQYHITAEIPATVNEILLQQLIEEKLAIIDGSLSLYRNDSELSRFNASDENTDLVVSNELVENLDISRDVYRKSRGAFDPSVKVLVELWGFGPHFSADLSTAHVDSIPTADQLAQAKAAMNFLAVTHQKNTLHKPDNVQLDFDGVAQGYTVDVIAKALEANAIVNYMVEVGGEVAVGGVNPKGGLWRIGIEQPDWGKSAQQVPFTALDLTGVGIATSGDYRNYHEINGKRYSHIIDPASGRPIDHKLASVTVVTASAAYADAWATALLVLGEDKGFILAEENDLAAYFIYRDKQGFAVKVTTQMLQYAKQ